MQGILDFYFVGDIKTLCANDNITPKKLYDESTWEYMLKHPIKAYGEYLISIVKLPFEGFKDLSGAFADILPDGKLKNFFTTVNDLSEIQDEMLGIAGQDTFIEWDEQEVAGVIEISDTYENQYKEGYAFFEEMGLKVTAYAYFSASGGPPIDIAQLATLMTNITSIYDVSETEQAILNYGISKVGYYSYSMQNRSAAFSRDCSSFLSEVANLGTYTGASTWDLSSTAIPMNFGALQPGSLVFRWKGGSKEGGPYNHVMMFLYYDETSDVVYFLHCGTSHGSSITSKTRTEFLKEYTVYTNAYIK